jgi:hypothetical protein
MALLAPHLKGSGPAPFQDRSVWDFSDLSLEPPAVRGPVRLGRRRAAQVNLIFPKPPCSPAPPTQSPRDFPTASGDVTPEFFAKGGIRLPALPPSVPSREASPETPVRAPVSSAAQRSPRPPPNPAAQLRSLMGPSRKRPNGETYALLSQPQVGAPGAALLRHRLLTSLLDASDTRRSNSMPPDSRPSNATSSSSGLVTEGRASALALGPKDTERGVLLVSGHEADNTHEPLRRKCSTFPTPLGSTHRLPCLKNGSQLVGKIVVPSCNT